MRFNDPRNTTGERNPLPPRFATSREELTGLLELCRAGRIYDVETWIADGRPLQISGTGPRRHGRRQATALEVAMERGDHSLDISRRTQRQGSRQPQDLRAFRS
jgi:hypothetical protein